MAVFKFTMLMQVPTAISAPNALLHRIAGFSESMYGSATSGNALYSAISTVPPNAFGFSLLGARASLLPLGGSMVGVRVQQVSPPGPAQLFPVSLAGSAQEADFPSLALLVRSPGVGVNNVRRFWLHAVPDSQVTEGEYTPTSNFGTLVEAYFGTLAGFQFRARDLSQPTNRIVSIGIAVSGVSSLLFENPTTLTVGSFVRILRTRDSNGFLRGGRFQVLSLGATGNSVNIGLWPFGNTTGGTGRLDGIVYPVMDTTQMAVVRVQVRRVGRPFTQFRGRRSRRHP